MTREEHIEQLELMLRCPEYNLDENDRETIKVCIKALSAEPCGDAISRQAVLEGIRNLYPDIPIVDIMGARRKWLEKYAPYFECENVVEQLPPVTPQQKMGKWIDTGSGQECSECGEIQYGYDNFRHFCANCGAKMEV